MLMKTTLGKVVASTVLAVGWAGAPQWPFASSTTLAAMMPSDNNPSIQTIRIHTPEWTDSQMTYQVDLLNREQKTIGTLVTTAATTPATKGNPGATSATLVLGDRSISTSYGSREFTVARGQDRLVLSYDNRDAAVEARLAEYSIELRLIGEIQQAARAVIDRFTATGSAVKQAGFKDRLAKNRVFKVIPAAWVAVMDTIRHDGPVCHMEPAHLHCGGSFATSRSLGCAYAQQEAHNECAAASGYCIGCCGFAGSGCDCLCLYDDMACMCESCGGTCGPQLDAPAIAPPVVPTKGRISAGH